MADSNNNPFFDFNWKNFEQFFGGKMPFVGGNPGMNNSGDQMSWVENYVRNALQQAMPNMDVQQLKHHFHTEIFDTHNNVIVKVHIPDTANAKKIRALLSTNQLRLEGLPDKASQTIRLNSQVVSESCRAVYKDGVMQFHMRKQKNEELFNDIDIRFL